MIHPHPNWLQRRYFTWAQPRYERMEPSLRETVQEIDLWLYSRRSVWAWLALLGVVALTTAALTQRGSDILAAFAISLLGWGFVVFMLLHAWLQPNHYTLGRLARGVALGLGTWLVLLLVLAAITMGTGDAPWSWSLLAARVWSALSRNGLFVLVVAAPLMALQIAFAQLRQRLTRAALAQSEARLHALQAQIQPHFLFNTLATVQHWVDSGDARASGLLRELTAFLRGATELLAQPRVRLADELACVGHYLAILQARLGGRLRVHTDVAADCTGFMLPPGLLLTLVENAVEHGLAPAIAGGELSVRAWRERGSVQIAVTDTGVGLAPDAKEGTGLANVRARIAAAWGARARLQLIAREGGGTVALLSVAHA